MQLRVKPVLAELTSQKKGESPKWVARRKETPSHETCGGSGPRGMALGSDHYNLCARRSQERRNPDIPRISGPIKD
jgi:hypothetical protein